MVATIWKGIRDRDCDHAATPKKCFLGGSKVPTHICSLTKYNLKVMHKNRQKQIRYFKEEEEEEEKGGTWFEA